MELKPFIMKRFLIIALLLGSLTVSLRTLGQDRNVREATAAEMAAGTAGLPAVVTPRRAGAASVTPSIVAANGGQTNDLLIKLFPTNSTAYVFGRYTNWPNSHSSGIQEAVNLFPWGTNFITSGCTIQFAPGMYTSSVPIFVTNRQYWFGAGQKSTVLLYTGPTNINAFITQPLVFDSVVNDGIVNFNAQNMAFRTQVNGKFYLLDLTNDEAVIQDCAFFGPGANMTGISLTNTGVIGIHFAGPSGNQHYVQRNLFDTLADGVFAQVDWGAVKDQNSFFNISSHGANFTNLYPWGDIRHIGAGVIAANANGGWEVSGNHFLGSHVCAVCFGAEAPIWTDNADENCDFRYAIDTNLLSSFCVQEINVSAANWLGAVDSNYNIKTSNGSAGAAFMVNFDGAILNNFGGWQIIDSGGVIATCLGVIEGFNGTDDLGFLDYQHVWWQNGVLHANGNGVTNLNLTKSYLPTNVIPIPPPAGSCAYYPSNFDLYWVTPLKTNLISLGH